MSGSPLPVAIEGLTVVYQRGADPALNDISLRVAPGEGLLVTGERGSGKSTLLRAIVGIVRFGGTVRVFGHYPGTADVAGRVGYAPQGKAFASGLSAEEMVATVAALRSPTSRADRSDIDRALGRAGIPDADRRRRIAEVEHVRRVALACALVGDPPLLVLDDPWEFPETVAAIAQTREAGGAVVAGSHDPGNLPQMLGRTLALTNGVQA